MLSYRHAFHAGNAADVHKHAVLSLLLRALRKKEAAFCCLDTHGGAGDYDLRSAEAQKNQEYLDGIACLWRRADLPPGLDDYLAAVRALNVAVMPAELHTAPRYYPGSPRLIRHALRPQDRLILTELHSTDIVGLRAAFKGDAQVAVHHLDAYLGLKAFLPPKERRGLVLLDPAFERQDEVERVARGLHVAWRRWPQGLFALWYPITHRASTRGLHQWVCKLGISHTLISEVTTRTPDASRRLCGSGMLLVNPPWGIEDELQDLGAYLAQVLAAGEGGSSRVAYLRHE